MAEILIPKKFDNLGESRLMRARFSRVHSLPAKSRGDHMAFNRRLRMLYAKHGPIVFKLDYGKPPIFNEPLDIDQINYLANSYPLTITELKDGLFFIGAKQDAHFPAYMLANFDEFDDFEYIEVDEDGLPIINDNATVYVPPSATVLAFRPRA